MTLHFSFADIYTAPEVVKLVNSAYRGPTSKRGWTTEADLLDGQRTDYNDIVKIIESPGSSILIARDEKQELIACCEIKFIPANFFDPQANSSEKNLYFGMFTVKPELQNAGIGKVFLEKIEEFARKWEVSCIQISVITHRTELISYYERRGFKKTAFFIEFPKDIKFGIPKVADLKMIILEKKLLTISHY